MRRAARHTESGNAFRGGGLSRVREAIQFKQNHAAQPEALANDQFAKIPIFGNQNPGVSVCGVEDIPVWRAWPRFGDRDHVMAAVSKLFDDKA